MGRVNQPPLGESSHNPRRILNAGRDESDATSFGVDLARSLMLPFPIIGPFYLRP
jgi:hypothetical protein